MSDKKKILYVDDEVLNLELFQVNLRDLYEVLIAESGLDALEILQKNSDVKIVISDLKMPFMDGFEFIQKVRESYPDMKCFILSGFHLDEKISDAIDSGLFDGHFTKPFDLPHITSTINEHLRG